MPSGARTLSLVFLGLSRNLAQPIANATSAAPRNRRLKASFRGTTPEWPTGKKPPQGSRLSGREPSAPEDLPHPEESLFQRQAALAAAVAAAAERVVRLGGAPRRRLGRGGLAHAQQRVNGKASEQGARDSSSLLERPSTCHCVCVPSHWPSQVLTGEAGKDAACCLLCAADPGCDFWVRPATVAAAPGAHC